MSGVQKTFQNIVDDFNVKTTTVFNKEYAEYEPKLNSLIYEFNSGAVPSTKMLINLLFGTLKPFEGSITYRKVDEIAQQLIPNKEYFVEGIEIANREMKRALQANSISGLDMYIKSIGNLPRIAKDGKIEKTLELLEAGTGSTLGTCFDNEPLFSTSHNFDIASGSQSNLLTGTGTTTAQISADVKKAINAMGGFYRSMDQDDNSNAKKRKLNMGDPNILVLCDPSLRSQMDDLRTLRNLSVSGGSTQDNTLRNSFDIETRFFNDPNDYYVIDISEPTIRPFFVSKEDEGRLITPTADNPEALANLQMHRYSYSEISFGNAYGAFWKIVKINNS